MHGLSMKVASFILHTWLIHTIHHSITSAQPFTCYIVFIMVLWVMSQTVGHKIMTVLCWSASTAIAMCWFTRLFLKWQHLSYHLFLFWITLPTLSEMFKFHCSSCQNRKEKDSFCFFSLSWHSKFAVGLQLQTLVLFILTGPR